MLGRVVCRGLRSRRAQRMAHEFPVDVDVADDRVLGGELELFLLGGLVLDQLSDAAQAIGAVAEAISQAWSIDSRGWRWAN